MADAKHLAKAMGGDIPAVFAENPASIHFQCPTCEYVRNGICRHKDPTVSGKHVTARNCCNHYDRPGMRKL